MQDIITQTIPVLADRRAEALKELEKLARKARRYGCPDITITVGETREEMRYVTDWDGAQRRVKTRMTDLLITGAAPRIGDHEFLAHVTLTPGGALVDTVPGIDDLEPRWRKTDGRCEHCHTSRPRKDVYIVRDRTTGKQIQVGRTCLRDYLGIDDPNRIAARFRFWRETRDSEWGSYGGWSWCQSLEGMLGLAAVTIRLFGWCSKGQASADDTLTSTASYVATALRPRSALEKEGYRQDIEIWDRLHEGLDAGDEKLARETIQWVRGLEPRSDYEHNLNVLFQDDVLTDPRRCGLVISAVAGYMRHVEREVRLTKQRQANVDSVHLGSEGERLRGLKVTQEMARVVGGSQFGECVLVKFRTEDGNVLTWFTGAGTGLQNGEEAVIDGTVKRHNEYQGNAETQLSRVRVH